MDLNSRFVFNRDTELPGFITEYSDANLILAGIPHEYKPSFRSGSNLAPYKIRETLNFIETQSYYQKRDIIDIKFHDLGNLNIKDLDFPETRELIIDFASEIYETGKNAGFIGGDHTILPPIFEAAKQSDPSTGLIIFDGHLDFRDSYLDDRYSHACVLKRIIDEHPRTPVLHIGSRIITKDESNFMDDLNADITVLNVMDVNKIDIQEACQTFATTNPVKVHLSFDMDCYDPSSAPGVCNPEFPGLSPLQAFQILHWIENEVRSFDICEFTPSFDVNGITAILAAKTCCELMLKAG
ncbi:MAG: agmatinase [Candidatus Hodarchaeales archaeon]